MTTRQPLLDYLSTCSETSLQAFELARLNDVANLRQQLLQQMVATVDQIVEAEIQARFARCIGERQVHPHHRAPQGTRRRRAIRGAQDQLPLLQDAQGPPKDARVLDMERVRELEKSSRCSEALQRRGRLKLASAG